jgi:hypothetical protein
VVDHHEEGKAACWKGHHRSSPVGIDTEEHAIAEHGRHDRGIVIDAKDSHGSAATLHGVGMEVDCIQDDCRVTEQAGHNCCWCSPGDTRRHVNTFPGLSPRYEAFRADPFPGLKSETWSDPNLQV